MPQVGARDATFVKSCAFLALVMQRVGRDAIFAQPIANHEESRLCGRRKLSAERKTKLWSISL